ALQSDFRITRARGNSRPRGGYRYHEPGTLLLAAPLRAFSELAFLAGPRHGTKSVPPDDLRALPTHRHSGRVRKSHRVRRLFEIAGFNQLYRQREKDLVGHQASPVLQHDRVSDLRRAIAGGRHCGAGCTYAVNRFQTAETAPAKHNVS